jgi:hypothetical protein
MVLLLWSSICYPHLAGDATSLKGMYKIELARAKHQYVEKRETPRFEPTDFRPGYSKI